MYNVGRISTLYMLHNDRILYALKIIYDCKSNYIYLFIHPICVLYTRSVISQPNDLYFYKIVFLFLYAKSIVSLSNQFSLHPFTLLFTQSVFTQLVISLSSVFDLSYQFSVHKVFVVFFVCHSWSLHTSSWIYCSVIYKCRNRINYRTWLFGLCSTFGWCFD